MVSCDDIARAHERIQEQAKRTPVLTSATVNARFISTQTGAGCMPIVSGRGSSSSWCFTPLFDKVAAKVVGKRKFRFKNKLVSIDSTTIDLCLSMFDWAKFTCTKEAVKLHLVLDHDGYLPRFAVRQQLRNRPLRPS